MSGVIWRQAFANIACCLSVLASSRCAFVCGRFSLFGMPLRQVWKSKLMMNFTFAVLNFGGFWDSPTVAHRLIFSIA